MSWNAIKWARKQRVGSTIAKFVLVDLAHYADEKGFCWPAQETIAANIESSVDSIQRAIKRYLEPKFLRRIKRKSADGRRVSNGYQLNLNFNSEGNDSTSCGMGPCGLDGGGSQAASYGATEPQRVDAPSRTLRPKYTEEIFKESLRRNLRDTAGGELLKKKLGEETFNSWLADVVIIGEEGQFLVLEVRSRFFAVRIAQWYEPRIIECFRDEYPGAVRVKAIVRKGAGGT